MNTKYSILKNLFIIGIIATFFAISCGNSFDPRAYNVKKKVSGGGGSTNGGEESGGNIPQPPAGEDPFQKLDMWWNDPNNGEYNASEIDSWFLQPYFVENDVPKYKFLINNPSGRTWILKDAKSQIYEDYGTACNTTAITGVSIAPTVDVKNVVNTRYKGMNTRFFNADTDYHKVYPGIERISRFYFYYFKGTPDMAKETESCLIVVDTYSKLIFAYGKTKSEYPTSPSWIKPSSLADKYSPTGEWVSIDNNTEIAGYKYPFYEYDPIGYVNKDGSIVIFDWYTSILGQHKTEPLKSDTSGPIIDNPFERNLTASAPRARSPYSYKDENQEARAFLSKVENSKVYSGRNPDSDGKNYGLILYSYKFSEDGKTLTYYEQEYRKNEKEIYVFTYVSEVSETEAIYSSDGVDYVFSLKKGESEYSKLLKDGTDSGVLNFKDPGPNFYLRAAGRTYMALNKTYSYKFSDDGKKVTYTRPNGTKVTYTYDVQKSGDSTRAAYKQQASMFWALRLSNNDTKIDSGTTPWSSGSDAIGGTLDYGYEAYLSDTGDDTVPDQFIIRTQGRTFSVRDTENSLILHKYIFSSEGDNINYEKIEWRNPTPLESKTFTDYNPIDDDNATFNGVKFSIKNNGSELYNEKNERIGNYNYSDPGPLFLDRVKDNPSFSGELSYQFKNGGQQIVIDGKTYNLERIEGNRNRAVYNIYNVIWRFYGVEFSNEDNNIKRTQSSSKEAIQWNTLGWQATRNE